jgi:hypothetical protein
MERALLTKAALLQFVGDMFPKNEHNHDELYEQLVATIEDVYKHASVVQPALLDAAATIEKIREIAAWFSDPSKSPLVRTRFGNPTMLLNDIADELKKTIATK